MPFSFEENVFVLFSGSKKYDLGADASLEYDTWGLSIKSMLTIPSISSAIAIINVSMKRQLNFIIIPYTWEIA